MHAIYELKDKLCQELEEYGQKGKLDLGALDIVDKLAHTIKNLDKIIEAYESEYSEKGNMYDGRVYDDGYGGRVYARSGDRVAENMGSYARGRRGNVRRDSMGRYSGADEMMISELKELMNDAPDDKTRMEFKKFIQKMEQHDY